MSFKEPPRHRVAGQATATTLRDGVSPPNDRTYQRIASTSQKDQLEKKRRSSREASARARKKTKNLIDELSNQNAILREEVTSLRARLMVSQAENTRLKMFQEEEQLRVMERGRKLNSLLQNLQQDQQQSSHRSYLMSPTMTTTMPPSLQPTLPAKVPNLSRYSVGHDVVAPYGKRHSVGTHTPNDSDGFLRNQMKIHELREETKGVRDFLARHSI